MNNPPISAGDAAEAYAIGLRRNQGHVDRGGDHKHGLKRTAADQDRDGMAAMSEATVAAMLGMDWARDTKGADGGTDVGGVIGVRWTPLPYGSLIIHPEDREDVPQVLVVGTAHPLRVVGWAWPREIKRPEYWRENVRNPAFFGPPWALRPMKSLMEWLESITTE
jgi:hypothetical protein